MIQLAANLSMLFQEQPFLQRFAAAADAGFRLVEVQSPYDFEPDQIAQQLQQHQLKLVLHNLPAGNWAAGERGIACHPDRIREFETGVDLAIRYASRLGVTQLNCLAGIVPADVGIAQANDTLRRNLLFAANRLAQHGIRLLIEPINTFDVPGFALSRSAQALELIRSIGSGNLFLQYDIYHMQRMEGDLTRTIADNLAVIGHIQLADNPGRGEPGSGEINFGNLLRGIDALGYQGYIGCEYVPRNGTVAGLVWRNQLGLEPELP
jgi:hydroxypyruvate isomerase